MSHPLGQLDHRDLFEQLQEQSKRVDEFAHDVRSPLSALMMYSEVLGQAASCNGAVSSSTVENSVDKLKTNINKIVDMVEALQDELDQDG